MSDPTEPLKSAPFPGFQNVAGVDQGYAPLHFRHALIDVQDRRAINGKRAQNTFLFGFKPDEDELQRLKAGETLYFNIWHDVIPPVRVFVGLSQEDLDAIDCVSCIEGSAGFNEWTRVKEEFNVKVFLNDVEQLQCSYASVKEGHVIRLVTEHGKPVRNGDEFQQEDAYGLVRLEFERIDQ